MPALQTVFDFFRGSASRRSSQLAPVPQVPSAPVAPPPVAPSHFAPPQVPLAVLVPSAPVAPQRPIAIVPQPAEAPITRLERDLSRRFGNPVRITITDNTRTMVSARHRAGVAFVRLHRMFVGADEQTLELVARFLKRRDARATAALRDYVADHQNQVRRRRTRRVMLSAIGEHHDLGLIYEELNAYYFDNCVDAQIGWGRMGSPPGRRRRRRSIKLGSYLSTGALIRVHPVLDAAWVPRFFVEYIVYHEMLHHVVEMPVQDGRRCMHGAEFKARERRFSRYAEAIAWEREHLDRLLAS
jgi:hypothetical protein